MHITLKYLKKVSNFTTLATTIVVSSIIAIIDVMDDMIRATRSKPLTTRREASH
jgi:hypothetical protein